MTTAHPSEPPEYTPYGYRLAYFFRKDDHVLTPFHSDASWHIRFAHAAFLFTTSSLLALAIWAHIAGRPSALVVLTASGISGVAAGWTHARTRLPAYRGRHRHATRRRDDTPSTTATTRSIS